MENTIQPLTPFVGRAHELDEIGALLRSPDCRLLTLVGPGGIGKTRLALEAGARHRDVFPDGLYFVPLAPLTHHDAIPTAIADATPYRFQPDGRDLRAQFLHYLQTRGSQRTLFILDNFEHVLAGVDIVTEMLAASPHLKLLVTSREALNLHEEWVRPIHGLPYPDAITPESLDTYAAVQLFIDRARRIRRDFDVIEEGDSVVEICRLTEGLPLAIELAVSWLKTLQPMEIADEIRRNMDILATRSRNLPERHRSIRSVFNHSWRLLSAHEREVFQRLSIFRGGFTRDAATEVAGTSLHTLADLVDKSLVRSHPSGRYDIHEMLRQYGAQQLAEAGQTEAVEHAYTDYFLRMLVRLEPDIKSNGQIAAHDAITADFENIRHAWMMAVGRACFDSLGAAAESLHFFADMRGRYQEVVALMQAALHAAADARVPDIPPVLRIQSRMVRLTLLGTLHLPPDLYQQVQHQLAAARARGDEAETGFCLMLLAMVLSFEDENRHAGASQNLLELLHESRDIFIRIGDQFYHAEALVWIGTMQHDSIPPQERARMVSECLALRQEIGDSNGIAWLTDNMAEAKFSEMDYEASERYARQSLSLMRSIGSTKGVLQSLYRLAQLNALSGNFEESRVLADELVTLAEKINSLDGRMSAYGLSSLLVGMMEEDYSRALALAQKSRQLAQERFFRGHSVMAINHGYAIALCGLGRYAEMRAQYPQLFEKYRLDIGSLSACFALEAVALAHENRLIDAAEMLGLAESMPPAASGWLQRFPLVIRLRASLLKALGANRCDAASARGAQRDAATVMYQLSGQKPPRAEAPALIDPLSRRELEILGLIAAGLSNRDIAEQLVLSVGTVKAHTRSIYGKLSVNSRTQALVEAARHNLLRR